MSSPTTAESPHNPFAPAPIGGAASSSSSTSSPFQNSNANSVGGGGAGGLMKPLIPMSGGAAAGGLTQQMNDLSISGGATATGAAGSANGGGGGNRFSLHILGGYVPPQTLLLNSAAGNGLEIQGTFARRQGQMMMEMSFTNRSMQTLTEFAILFNKNSFALTPGGAIQVKTPLYPNQSADGTLSIAVTGVPNLMNPINNLQVALKTNLGIVYFQTLIPLHILLTEDGTLDQQTWLRMWRDEIPQANETKMVVEGGLQFVSIDAARNKLHLNNVFAVAQRVIDGVPILYTACRLQDIPSTPSSSVMFLSELRFDASLTSCIVSTKTFGVQFAGAFHAALEGVLRS
ncbi:AP-1 complex subunit beta-1 [Quaeritorhiza haematococci]|nr:AP-1 complex subunit beta-1 [Quaeritorhiza haematococci]